MKILGKDPKFLTKTIPYKLGIITVIGAETLVWTNEVFIYITYCM